MKKHAGGRKVYFDPIEAGETGLLRRAEEIRGDLFSLRSPADFSRKRAVDFARQIKVLGREIERHFAVEEKVLFPFIRRHVPRAESSVLVLTAEHQDFRRDLRSLGRKLQRFLRRRTKPMAARELKELCETGLRLTYFLSHHIRHETHSVHRITQNDLCDSERAFLSGLIRRASRS